MNQGTWLPLRYRDFHDVPRLVAVEYRGRVYLLDSPFDDAIDDHSEHYTVFRLPASAVARLDDGSWEGLPHLAEEISRVRVPDVEFDEPKPQRLSDSLFRRLGIQ